MAAKSKTKKTIAIIICALLILAVILYYLFFCILRMRYIGRYNRAAEHLKSSVSEFLDSEGVRKDDESLKGKTLYMYIRHNGGSDFIEPCELFPEGKESECSLAPSPCSSVVCIKDGNISEIWCADNVFKEVELRPYDFKDQKKQYGSIFEKDKRTMTGYWSPGSDNTDHPFTDYLLP